MSCIQAPDRARPPRARISTLGIEGREDRWSFDSSTSVTSVLQIVSLRNGVAFFIEVLGILYGGFYSSDVATADCHL